jgi:O-antigen biosynthesis protein
MKKPSILAWRNDWSQAPEGHEPLRGTGYYRIVKPLLALQDVYETFVFGKVPMIKGDDGRVVPPEETIQFLIKRCDLFFMKNVSNDHGYARFLAPADVYNKPVILDMDDDYINVDDLHPDRSVFRPGTEQTIVHELLFQSVTAMIVASEPLVEIYKPFCKNIHVLKNYNDITEWKYPVKKRKDGRVCIGWCGSSTHESDFLEYYGVMKELWRRYGNKIVFSFHGFAPVDIEEEFPREAYEITTGTPTMLSYIKALAEWGYDIGVAPLKHSKFNDGKGHGKWMEYGSYKIPMVGEKYGPYLRECKDGEDALLCSGVDEWVGALTRLIEDEEERKRIGEGAYKSIVRDWQWKDNAWRWKEVFDKYLTNGFHYDKT